LEESTWCDLKVNTFLLLPWYQFCQFGIKRYLNFLKYIMLRLHFPSIASRACQKLFTKNAFLRKFELYFLPASAYVYWYHIGFILAFVTTSLLH